MNNFSFFSSPLKEKEEGDEQEKEKEKRNYWISLEPFFPFVSIPISREILL